MHKRQRLAQMSAATIRAIQDSCSAAASQLRCSSHGRAASVTVEGENLASLEINISGCCDEFVNQVRAALKQGPLA